MFNKWDGKGFRPPTAWVSAEHLLSTNDWVELKSTVSVLREPAVRGAGLPEPSTVLGAVSRLAMFCAEGTYFAASRRQDQACLAEGATVPLCVTGDAWPGWRPWRGPYITLGLGSGFEASGWQNQGSWVGHLPLGAS